MNERGVPGATLGLTAESLEHLAFNGEANIVYRHYRGLPPAQRQAYWGRYTLNQAIRGAIDHASALDPGAPGTDEVVAAIRGEVATFVAEFAEYCRRRKRFPLELFQAVEWWAAFLSERRQFVEALGAVRLGFDMGVRRYPAIRVGLSVLQAHALFRIGEIGQAKEILADLAERPYLLVDRNLTPTILKMLHDASLAAGDGRYHKQLIWRSILLFYTNDGSRRLATEQISRSYRWWYRALVTRDVRLRARALYALHLAHFAVADVRALRALRLDRLSRLGLLGACYAATHASADSSRHVWVKETARRPDSVQKPRAILVTRAMGGLGDVLMMTPGLHALKQRYPDTTVYFAVPKQFHAVFQGNPDVELLDIEHDRIDPAEYARWYNLTDCPAARIEGRTAPRVTRTRIEIFAEALGIRGGGLRQMSRTPRYFVSQEERAFANTFFRDHGLLDQPVIGLHLSAAETYRDYPFFEALAVLLAATHKVIVFDSEDIDGYDHRNVLKAAGLPIRQAFALAAGCRLLVAPDSAFLHLAAAVDLPTLGLFGPTDGRVRVRHYPRAVVMDAREHVNCIPCWRNEIIPCAITNSRASACMKLIDVERLRSRIEKELSSTA